MPIHDWSRAPSGLFHDFHQTWCIEIRAALNRGLLPKELSAIVEQRTGPKEGDVLAIESWSPARRRRSNDQGELLVKEAPSASVVRKTTKEIYADRASRIAVRHNLGRIVAIIEIVSPGNKDSRAAMRDFIDKTIAFMRHGVHLLIVDLFPPSPRDPFGIHKAIWDEISEEDFHFPPGKDRIVASYEMGHVRAAYVDTIGVGDSLPAAPLFLSEGIHIKVPLETTYQQTWETCPDIMRTAVETGVMPDPDAEE